MLVCRLLLSVGCGRGNCVAERPLEEDLLESLVDLPLSWLPECSL